MAGHGQQTVVKNIDLLGNSQELFAPVEWQGKSGEAIVAKAEDLERVSFGVELEELVNADRFFGAADLACAGRARLGDDDGGKQQRVFGGA